MQRFVVAVDTQTDFMRADGALSVAGAEALIAPMQQGLESLRPTETAGVLFAFDTHSADAYPGSVEAKQFPIHCVHRTPGWASMLDFDTIDRAIPVYRLEKGVFDMWAEPDVAIELVVTGEKMLRDVFFVELKARDVTEAAVISVAADYCVRWVIEGLVARGFAVDVPPGLSCGIARPIAQVVAEDFADAPVRLESVA